MLLTIEEAALLKDRFETFVDGLVGEDVTVKRSPDAFTVDILRKMKRQSHIRPQLAEDIDG